MTAIDFSCPVCQASVGEDCRGRAGYIHEERLHVSNSAWFKSQEATRPLTFDGVGSSDGISLHVPPVDPGSSASASHVTVNITPSCDRLADIFDKQRALMRLYGLHPDQLCFMPAGFLEEFAQKVCVATAREVFEILDELPWKWWHAKVEVDRDRYLNEVADLLHFCVELALLFDADAEELHRRYCAKNQINIDKANRRLQERRGEAS